MTVPTISQNAPYVWAVLGGSNVGIPTIAQDAPYVWTLSADANGNAITENYFFNVLDYGAIGDGATDCTTAISNAITAAAVNGGIVFFPPGTFLSGNQTLKNNVGIMGCGMSISLIKLKNATNDDLFSAFTANINLSGTSGTGPNTAVTNFFFKDITLDGNKVGQSGGTSYPLRYYGYWDMLINVEIKNGYTGGFQRDYYGSTSAYNNSPRREPTYQQFFVHDCNGIGVELGGPTDSFWAGGDVNSNGSHNIHLCNNGRGLVANQVHSWCSGIVYGRVPWLLEAQACLMNCEAEGGDTVQLALLANQCVFQGGSVYAGAHNGAGIQFGQVATAVLATGVVASPFTLTTAPNTVGQACYLQHVITGAGASGSLAIVGTDYAGNAQSENLACSGNGTFTSVNAYATITSETVTGLAGFSIIVNGLPLPYSGQILQSGGVTTSVALSDYIVDTLIHDIVHTNGSLWFVNDQQGSVKAQIKQTVNTYYTGVFNRATTLQLNNRGIASGSNDNIAPGLFQLPGKSLHTLMVTDGGSIIFDVNTSSKRAELLQNAPLYFYSDNFTTLKLRLENGTVCLYPSSTSPGLASNGTITTSGVGIARVTPTANVTGVIMQTGSIAGQHCEVENQSAFWIQMAASGTSNVASGTSDYIAPNTGALYVWSTSDSLWYRVDPPASGMPLIVAFPGIENATAGITIVAGAAYFQLVTVNFPVTLTQIRTWFSGSPSGNTDMGIYDSTGTNGAPNNKLASTGAIATVTAMFTQNLTANKLLMPGTYWLSMLNTTANSLQGRLTPAAGMGAIYRTSATNLTILPSTAGSIAIDNTLIQMYALVLGGYS